MAIPGTSLRTLGWVMLVWVAVLLSRMVPLGGEWRPVAPLTYLLLASWLAVYSASWLLGAALWPKRMRRIQIDPLIVDRRVFRFAIAACIGALLLILEFALIRGYGFWMPVAEIRQLEVMAVEGGRGGSIISGIARLLMPALIVAWIILRQSDGVASRQSRWVLYIATAVVLWAQSVFEGGRFFLAALVLAGLLSGGQTAIIKRKGHRPLPILIASTALLFMGIVFLQRVGVDLKEAYSTFSSSFQIDVESDIFERLDGQFAALWFPAMMFWVYITHAVNELDLIVALPSLDHALGIYQFPQLGQAARLLFDSTFDFNVFDSLPTIGVYLTAYGAWYVDFGLIGAYIGAGVFGSLTGAATVERAKGSAGGLAVSAPILVVVALFLPIHSLITTVWPAIVFALLFCSARTGPTLVPRSQTRTRFAHDTVATPGR